MFKRVVQEKLVRKSRAFAFIIVFLSTFIFVYFTAEESVFNREDNMFEVLKLEPFATSSEIDKQISVHFPDRETEYEKQFEYLMQKNYHDQYYKFGEIDIDLNSNDVDERHAVMFTRYIIYTMLALVFMGEELPAAKRV